MLGLLSFQNSEINVCCLICTILVQMVFCYRSSSWARQSWRFSIIIFSSFLRTSYLWGKKEKKKREKKELIKSKCFIFLEIISISRVYLWESLFRRTEMTSSCLFQDITEIFFVLCLYNRTSWHIIKWLFSFSKISVSQMN